MCNQPIQNIMEDTKKFTVLITGIGAVSVQACTKHHARQVAYAKYCHIQPELDKYHNQIKTKVSWTD